MEIREISIDQINEPAFDVRTLIIKEDLDELAESIKATGLLYDILVFEVKGRYEIEDGHRRYLAHKMLGKQTISCKIIDSPENLRELRKLHANIHSKGLTATELSRTLNHLKTRFGYTHEQLAKLMGKTQGRISQLLGIQNWAPDIKEAMEDEKLSEHLGYELNKIKRPEMRKYYTKYALDGGATLNVVKSWVQKELIDESLPEPPEPPKMDLPPDDQPIVVWQRCACCSEDFDPQTLLIMRMCGECYADVRRIMPEIRQAIKEEKASRGVKKPSIEPED